MLQREALALFTFEELSLEEIAKITGVDHVFAAPANLCARYWRRC
jgi:2-keto-3-deoxy-L-rhamnonate aldolase RhmA